MPALPTYLQAVQTLASDGTMYGTRPSDKLEWVKANAKTPTDKKLAAQVILEYRASGTPVETVESIAALVGAFPSAEQVADELGGIAAPMPPQGAPRDGKPAHEQNDRQAPKTAPMPAPVAPVAKPTTKRGFAKAEKRTARARIALDGPAGSGKTYTALVAATVLAEGGKIAVIDTERGSASLYADKFDFDVLELDTFNPREYISAIELAEREGYSVIVIDSLSHAWEGEGGALEMVDNAAAKSQSKNTYFAWRDVTPLQRGMVDSMLQSKCHIIATMRTKTEYIIETDHRGKQVPRKVGTAPVQRAGIEYEFTIVGDIDIDHKLVISKSRCDLLADKVEVKPGPNFWRVLADWLK